MRVARARLERPIMKNAMKPAEALALIKRAAMTQQLEYQTHARRRMAERRVRRVDVEQACLTAPEAILQDNERWRLDGQDASGDDLTVIVTIDAGIVIVTVF